MMNEKEEVKLGKTGLFLIIAIVIIAIMCIFICKLSKEKTVAESKVNDLQNQVASLNGTISNLNNTINELQGKLKTISDTINSANSKQSTDVQSLIIGKWKAAKVFDKEGKELSLNNAFGTGIRMSNEMEFKENGVLQYSISITPSSDSGKYTIEGNTIKYGVPSDIKDVFTWHTATYNIENDTIEEHNLTFMGESVIYTRIK